MRSAARSGCMYPFGRLARVLAASPLRPPLATFDESVVRFRVWPGDLDTNGHLNNGRYLTLMDLGRWDLVARVGLAKPLARQGWWPVVAAATLRFRRSLEPFQRYELRTRILGWDARGFYLEQRFERAGEGMAVGAIRAVFLSKDGKVAPERIVALVAPGVRPPPLPRWLTLWLDALDAQASENGAATLRPPAGPGEMPGAPGPAQA